MASELSDELLLELSRATGASVEQLRAAFALVRVYKRRMKKTGGAL